VAPTGWSLDQRRARRGLTNRASPGVP
jgi:hypothetical protein